ncbi:hypothetical protein GGD63_005112 [Bradyrhizobium sp. cir1]|nr:hypothetical protein [Bradyrhizobium sp. cir1]
MKAEGNQAGQKQHSPSHDQEKRKHYRSLWFVMNEKTIIDKILPTIERKN